MVRILRWPGANWTLINGVHGVAYLRTTFHLLPALVAGLGVSGSLSNVLPSDAFDCDRAGPLVDWAGTHGNGRHSWLKQRTTCMLTYVN